MARFYFRQLQIVKNQGCLVKRGILENKCTNSTYTFSEDVGYIELDCEMMKYFKVHWIHESFLYPEFIYSEVGIDGYEIRKIDIYKDGKIGYATGDFEFNGAGLSEKPYPSLEELNGKDEWDEMITIEISEIEFNNAWKEKVLTLHKL